MGLLVAAVLAARRMLCYGATIALIVASTASHARSRTTRVSPSIVYRYVYLIVARYRSVKPFKTALGRWPFQPCHVEITWSPRPARPRAWRYVPMPGVAFGDDFVLIDMSGVVELGLDFCGCTCALPHYTQLLRTRWYPATSISPKSAATFQVLEHFQLLSAYSKLSGWEFYTSLVRRTDNTGVHPPKVRRVHTSAPRSR